MALLCPSRSTPLYPLETDEDALSLLSVTASTNTSLEQLEKTSASNATGNKVEEVKTLLISLPMEIKIKIYEYALAVRPVADPAGNNAVATCLGPVDPTKKIGVSKNAFGLLLTCKAIYMEAYFIYVACNTFLMRKEPYSGSETSFLVRNADLIRSVAVELYLEDLVWLASMGSIQNPSWEDEFGPIIAGSRYYVPGFKYMKAVKAALLPLKKLKNIHILVKGWSKDEGDMPFRFLDARHGPSWSLDKSALCIKELVEKWMKYVLVEKGDDQSTRPGLTLQIEARWTNDEHQVLETVWGDSYRCLKPVHWV